MLLGVNAMQTALTPLVRNATAAISAQSAGNAAGLARTCHSQAIALNREDVSPSDERFAAWIKECLPVSLQV